MNEPEKNDSPPFAEPVQAESAAPANKPAASEQLKQVADKAAEKASELMAQAAPVVTPLAEQLKVNLKVWAPFLRNPDERSRLVQYKARERQASGLWSISMPEQCWKTGQKENVQPKKFLRTIRCFEYPLQLGVGGFGLALFLFFMGVLGLFSETSTWGGVFIWLGLSMSVVIFTCGALFIKSWTEDVRMIVFTSPEHAEELKAPEVAVEDQELFFFAPTSTLADAALAALKEERKQAKGKGGPSAPANVQTSRPVEDLPSISMDGEEKPSGQTSKPKGIPITPQPHVREELPPIKLAGDDETEKKQ